MNQHSLKKDLHKTSVNNFSMVFATNETITGKTVTKGWSSLHFRMSRFKLSENSHEIVRTRLKHKKHQPRIKSAEMGKSLPHNKLFANIHSYSE
jgi:hypothetical protein